MLGSSSFSSIAVYVTTFSQYTAVINQCITESVCVVCVCLGASVRGDLARGRTFTASSTCGLSGPETFCALERPSTAADANGPVRCFTCDASGPQISHPARFLSDAQPGNGARTWWQAEAGAQNVTLELELGALFSLAELVVTFRSPRPAALAVERSRDFGATYEPYRFFSSDCEGDFGIPERSGVQSSDEVICTPEFCSIEPLTDGQVSTTQSHQPLICITSTLKFFNKCGNEGCKIHYDETALIRLGGHWQQLWTMWRYRYGSLRKTFGGC